MEGQRANPYLINPFTLPLFPPSLPPFPLPTNHTTEASSTKKKIRIQWIDNDAQRLSTFKKRRKGIMKKAEELHILCGVKTCVIIYGAGETKPEVWPSTEEVVRMCRSFRQMPELDRVKMMRTHAHFLQDLMCKKGQQLWHQYDEIVDAQTRCYVYDALMGADMRGVSREGLIRVHAMIREMLQERYEWCSTLRGKLPEAPPPLRALLPHDSNQEQQPQGGDAAMRVGAGEVPPMEALVNRFLYGEDAVPSEENSSWGMPAPDFH